MKAALVMFKANGQRKDFAVTNAATTLGRGEEADLRVPIGSVSRLHCKLTLSDKALTVKDLGSSNGTLVNGERITEAQLKAGDRLTMGPISFTVQIDGVPAKIVPPPKTAPQAEIVEDVEDLEEVEELEEVQEAVAAPAGKADDDDDPFAAIAMEADGGEVDPIAALEALAAESDEDDEDEGRKKS